VIPNCSSHESRALVKSGRIHNGKQSDKRKPCGRGSVARFNLASKIALWVILPCALGCTSQELIPLSLHEISGTKSKRTAAIARLFPTVDPYTRLTDAFKNARLIELKFGDGILGPADYCSYLWIEVPPEQVSQWKSILQPTTAPLLYDAPPTKPSWWLTQTRFDLLPKYDPFPLFQRNGWIAVDDLGNIFARTCTQ